MSAQPRRLENGFFSGPLAVLGATSYIARDFIRAAHASHSLDLTLFARRPSAVADFVAANNLPGQWRIASLADFASKGRESSHAQFSGVLNFVGVGDPAKAAAMGDAIFDATYQSDRAALEYICRFPDTPYIFMSSGAVYGGDFHEPVTERSTASFPINSLQAQDSYGIAKLHAEAVHRALTKNTIIDIRIFNYFSRTVDVSARYLITEMIEALRHDKVFETTEQVLMRDYLHPNDFYALVVACLKAPLRSNMPVDAYSRAPVSKADLLKLFSEKFGLKYRIVPEVSTVNATGFKRNYYSENRAAAKLGYKPQFTSADAIVQETRAILAGGQ